MIRSFEIDLENIDTDYKKKKMILKNKLGNYRDQ